jgi:hypothetical protein
LEKKIYKIDYSIDVSAQTDEAEKLKKIIIWSESEKIVFERANYNIKKVIFVHLFFYFKMCVSFITK